MHNVAQFTQCEYIWGTKPQNHQNQPHWQTAEFGPGKNSRENDVSKTLCSVFLTKARCSWGNSFLKWHITTYIWAFPSTMQLVTSVIPLGLAPNHGYQGLITSPVGQTFPSLPLSADIPHLSFQIGTHTCMQHCFQCTQCKTKLENSTQISCVCWTKSFA